MTLHFAGFPYYNHTGKNMAEARRIIPLKSELHINQAIKNKLAIMRNENSRQCEYVTFGGGTNVKIMLSLMKKDKVCVSVVRYINLGKGKDGVKATTVNLGTYYSEDLETDPEFSKEWDKMDFTNMVDYQEAVKIGLRIAEWDVTKKVEFVKYFKNYNQVCTMAMLDQFEKRNLKPERKKEQKTESKSEPVFKIADDPKPTEENREIQMMELDIKLLENELERKKLLLTKAKLMQTIQ